MLSDRLTGPAHDWVKLLSVDGTVFFAKIKIVSRETRIISLKHNINGAAGFCYFKDYREKRIFWKVDEFRGAIFQYRAFETRRPHIGET